MSDVIMIGVHLNTARSFAKKKQVFHDEIVRKLVTFVVVSWTHGFVAQVLRPNIELLKLAVCLFCKCCESPQPPSSFGRPICKFIIF